MLFARETSVHDNLAFFFSPLKDTGSLCAQHGPILVVFHPDKSARLLDSLPSGDNRAATLPLKSPGWSNMCVWEPCLLLRPALAPAVPAGWA